MANAGYEKKHPYGMLGRRPEYTDPNELDKRCQEYFKWCAGEVKTEIRTRINDEGEEEEYTVKIVIREPERYTITGLGLFLGFCSRNTLDYYESKPEFSDIIKRAKYRVENRYEVALEQNNSTGSIFALKNMGWIDKQDVHNTGETTQHINLQSLPDELLTALSEAIKNNQGTD